MIHGREGIKRGFLRTDLACCGAGEVRRLNDGDIIGGSAAGRHHRHNKHLFFRVRLQPLSASELGVRFMFAAERKERQSGCRGGKKLTMPSLPADQRRSEQLLDSPGGDEEPEVNGSIPTFSHLIRSLETLVRWRPA